MKITAAQLNQLRTTLELEGIQIPEEQLEEWAVYFLQLVKAIYSL